MIIHSTQEIKDAIMNLNRDNALDTDGFGPYIYQMY